MAPQYSSPTRLRDYIAFLLPWAHGHQLKAIGDFVAAIIEQQTACQAQLARYFGKQEAAVKRLSRLLHNERLDPRLLADAVLLQALHQLPTHGTVRLAVVRDCHAATRVSIRAEATSNTGCRRGVVATLPGVGPSRYVYTVVRLRPRSWATCWTLPPSTRIL